MIKTNKVKLEIHYDHINRDYDLYRIQPKQTDDKDEEKCVLKRSLEKLDQLSPVLAVLYRYKGPVYLIFEKGRVCLEDLQSHINQYDKGAFVETLDINDPLSITPTELSQLLINMLPNMEFSQKFNNISGRYFSFNQKSFRKDCILAYHISLIESETSKQECMVYMEGESYHRLSKVLEYNNKYRNDILKLPRYYKSNEGYVFRRCLTPLSTDQCFVRRSVYRRQREDFVNSLDIHDIQGFENSKCGMLHQFYIDVDLHLNDYVQLHPIDLNNEQMANTYSDFLSQDYIRNLYNDLGVHLIDRVNDSSSKKMIDLIVSKLKDRGIDNIHYDKGKQFNIALIHNQKYCKNNKIPDQHVSDLNFQHITYETCIARDNTVDISDNIMDRILMELLIKRDIANRSISIYHWNWDKPVEYVTRESERCGNKKITKYFLLSVFPDGSMDYYKIEDDTSELYQRYESVFTNYKSSVFEPELLISTQDYQALVSDSKMMVLPDLKELDFRLNAYRKDKEISKSKLTRLLKSFVETNEEYREEIERILKNLNKNTYQYQEVVRKASKAGNPPLINLATSLGRKFVKHCRDTSRVVFNPCLKSDVVKVFQHIYTLKDEEDSKKLYYYVGKKEPMKFTLVNACHIRRITVLEGALDDDFKKFIFDQLSVNFIRNNDYTVVPFLRKYIEEFKKLNSQ